MATKERTKPATAFEDPTYVRKRWTTIVLEERSDGGWRATQTGVDVEGRGATAAAAAADYCERIAATGDA